MKKVEVTKAVGMALCHDITQIIPGQFKGRFFKKGHIITEEDIPKLLDLGKRYIYMWDLTDGYLHENEAAIRIANRAAGKNFRLTEPKEGKVEFIAETDGFLKIDKEKLFEANRIENIIIATIHGNRLVKKGQRIAGARIIPLAIEEEIIESLEKLICKPFIEVLPLKSFKVGLIITGTEVYSGRIEDKFGPVIIRKIEELKSRIIKKELVSDSIEKTVNAINNMRKIGADMILITGGMSVDPDDLTSAAIKKAGADVKLYGVPVLPGAMFLLGYLDGNVPIMGLPGCVMYYKTSIFDLIVPRVMAGEYITKEDTTKLAYGGFCLNCKECIYPNCPFGK
ncbi:MAG: molybdopterin-binding protein [Deltaproteobacteria bacterium]|nr:molybdopterin-binding protein [Deltaproteobacteria bacterium]